MGMFMKKLYLVAGIAFCSSNVAADNLDLSNEGPDLNIKNYSIVVRDSNTSVLMKHIEESRIKTNLEEKAASDRLDAYGSGDTYGSVLFDPSKNTNYVKSTSFDDYLGYDLFSSDEIY